MVRRGYPSSSKGFILAAVTSQVSANMAEKPKTPDKKLSEVTSKAIKLRDPAKQASSSTIETVWQMTGGAITKGIYVGAPGRWTLQASGAPLQHEMAAQLDVIEARLLAERTSS
jgi:hypothetical protein